mmetsp:Transcript_47868/g.125321  ORF Transcript_47868/g.125321 Transcript_47868/m.125321 type:complete len:237 (-) Transcript_47868:123-833(-)
MRPVFVGELVLALFDATVHLGVGLAIERWRRRKQDVHDHADRPHVARRAILAQLPTADLLRKHFGCDIAWCAAARSHQEIVRQGGNLREPEVRDFQLGIWLRRCEQDVLRLEIAVADIAVMEVQYGIEHFEGEVARVILGEFAETNDAVKELATSEQLHDEVQSIWALVDVVKSDDVRMLDRAENLYFCPQHLDTFDGFARRWLLHHLDGDPISNCELPMGHWTLEVTQNDLGKVS